MPSQYIIKAKKIIDQERIDRIKEFYKNEYRPDATIPLKFRFIKSFMFDENSGLFIWRSLHTLLNKRRFNENKLREDIIKAIDLGFTPIRIFHSVSNWLAPNEIRYTKSQNGRLLNSGLFVLESDKNLKTSIEVAAKISQIYSNHKLYLVFSGNRSIHVWFSDFDFTQIIKNPTLLDNEKDDLKARRKFFYKLPTDLPARLDPQTSIDSRRVVPIIGTLNGFTMKRVTLLKELMDEEQIQIQSKVN